MGLTLTARQPVSTTTAGASPDPYPPSLMSLTKQIGGTFLWKGVWEGRWNSLAGGDVIGCQASGWKDAFSRFKLSHLQASGQDVLGKWARWKDLVKFKLSALVFV